jgi:hypothetical protein
MNSARKIVVEQSHIAASSFAGSFFSSEPPNKTAQESKSHLRLLPGSCAAPVFIPFLNSNRFIAAIEFAVAIGLIVALVALIGPDVAAFFRKQFKRGSR